MTEQALLDLIARELKTIEAHAILTHQLAASLIKKIEGIKTVKRRPGKGLTDADMARIKARLYKTMYNKKP